MKDQMRTYFQAYLDDELSPQLRGVVEAYLAREPEARRELDALRETSRLLQGWKEVDPPSDFRQRMAAAIREEAPPETDAEPARRQSRRRDADRPGNGRRTAASEPDTIPLSRPAKPKRSGWRDNWPTLVKAVGATAAVLAVMIVGGRLFFSSSQANPDPLTLARMAKLVGEARNAEEVADMGLYVETAQVAALSVDRPNMDVCSLVATAEAVTANVQIHSDQRMDLRALLRALNDRVQSAQAAAPAPGQLMAAEPPSGLSQRSAMRDILELERQGNVDAAAGAYEGLVPASADQNARLIVHKVYCALRRGDFAKARQQVQLLSEAKDVPPVYAGLGAHLGELTAEVQQAHKQCEALRLDFSKKPPPELLKSLAHAEMKARQYSQAARDLKSYASFAPDRTEEFVSLVKAAWCLRMDGQFEAAKKLLEQALGRSSHETPWLTAWIRFELAGTFLRQGQYNDAVLIYDGLHGGTPSEDPALRSLQAASVFLSGYLRLYCRPGEQVVRRGDWEAACERFEPLVKLYPETVYAKIAGAYLGSQASPAGQ